MNGSIGGKARKVFAPVAVEVASNGRRSNVWVRFAYKGFCMIAQREPLGRVAHQIEQTVAIEILRV